MDQQRITGLGERGQRAADVLVERFTGAGWANHRWVRFRSVLGMLERLLSTPGRCGTPIRAGRGDLPRTGRRGGSPRAPTRWRPVPPSGSDQLQGIATSWREPGPAGAATVACWSTASHGPAPGGRQPEL